MKIILFTFFCAILVSCNHSRNPIQQQNPSAILQKDTLRVSKEFKGIYKNDGQGKFIDCDHPEMTYLTKNNDQLDSALNKILPSAYKGEGIYAEINAEMNGTDSKEFAGILEIKQVRKAEQKSEKNTCIPYDFWGRGTEPFWLLQISKSENLIDFYDPMQQKTFHFLYAEPQTKDGVITYVSTEVNNAKSKIQVSIYKEKCSDGMSDKAYDYRAEVIMDKRYKGCAVKFGEK